MASRTRAGHKIFSDTKLAAEIAAWHSTGISPEAVREQLRRYRTQVPDAATIRAFLANFLSQMDPAAVEEAKRIAFNLVQARQDHRALLIENRATAIMYYEEMVEFLESMVMHLHQTQPKNWETTIPRYIEEIRQYRQILDRLTGDDVTDLQKLREAISACARLAMETLLPAVKLEDRVSLAELFRRRLDEYVQKLLSGLDEQSPRVPRRP